jgi:hypothetical protein
MFPAIVILCFLNVESAIGSIHQKGFIFFCFSRKLLSTTFLDSGGLLLAVNNKRGIFVLKPWSSTFGKQILNMYVPVKSCKMLLLKRIVSRKFDMLFWCRWIDKYFLHLLYFIRFLKYHHFHVEFLNPKRSSFFIKSQCCLRILLRSTIL